MNRIARYIIEAEQPDWWGKLSRDAQEQYIKDHPKSKVVHLFREREKRQRSAVPQVKKPRSNNYKGSVPDVPKHRDYKNSPPWEFEKHLQSLFPGAKIALTGQQLTAAGKNGLNSMHRSHWNYVSKELTELHTAYPDVKLHEIRIYDPNDPAEHPGVRDDDKCYARGGDGILWFNSRYYSVPLDFRLQDSINSAGMQSNKVVNGKIIPPWHDTMTDPASIVAHEFGHNVHSWLEGSNNPDKFPSVKNKMFTKMVRPDGFGLIGETINTFLNYHFNAATKDHSKAATGYALSTRKEWFAETFAATRYGSENTKNKPQVKYMKAFIEMVADSSKHKELHWSDEFTKKERAAHFEEVQKLRKKLGLPDNGIDY